LVLSAVLYCSWAVLGYEGQLATVGAAGTAGTVEIVGNVGTDGNCWKQLIRLAQSGLPVQ
jgi:hypothetical protein